MTDHLTIHRGRIVEPRHLRLVTTWPDETDTDQHYADDGNPIASAVMVSLTMLALCGFIGFVIWAAT